jgi:branched-chain amino acid aminotransferase
MIDQSLLFSMEQYILFNGKFFESSEPVVGAENRGLRYGDGLFETMKILNHRIVNTDLHMDRLFEGLSLLQFEIPSFFNRQSIHDQVVLACEKNKLDKARVRLAVFRGNGGLYDPVDHKPNLLIQVWPLPEGLEFNENGLVLGVYPDIRKSCDRFSNLKSANYLPYVMAAIHAKKQHFNDSLVLNTHGRVCDASISNVFCLKNGIICTPSLNEGCVAGVMRRYLLARMFETGYKVLETELSVEDLLEADEIFLTNAISGIRWVKQFGHRTYSNHVSAKLFNQFIAATA